MEKIIDKVIDTIGVMVYGIDYETYRVIYANQKTVEAFPEIDEDLPCYTIFHGRKTPCKSCPLKRLLQNDREVRLSLWVDRLNRWLEVAFEDYECEPGRHLCLCSGMDVTGLQKSLHMTESVLDGLHAAAYTVGIEDYKIQSVNQGLRKMLPDIETGTVCYRALWDRNDPCVNCPIPRLRQENDSDSMEVYNPKLGRYLSIDSVRVNGMNGRPAVVFTGYDITRRVESEARLKVLAYYDVMLGVRNRNAFMEDLAGLYEQELSFRVCMINIKNFDSYNVIYGRQAGDQLLMNMAEYYKDSIDNEKVYRVGGGKFAFIIFSEAEYSYLREQIEQWKNAELLLGEKNHFRLFLDSVVIDVPEFASNPELLMHNAEYMLDKSRNTEKGEEMVFGGEEQRALEKKKKITSIIRRALEKNRFFVYYQPIYSIEKYNFPKCEALLRLNDEDEGFIPPSEFIPAAEESGLIHELGQFVLEEACRLIEWRGRQGLPPIQVNVNVSTTQFSRRSFLDEVLTIVNKYDIDRSLLQLEVTESILINSFEYIIDIMKRLIEEGISFAVDDFGTGYSSLSYIGTLPVQAIKLDKSFIDRIAESEIYVLIVRNVIEIAKGLHFKIVAEGVEDEQQLMVLKRLGCDYIQGYLFSKPLPEEEFTRFMYKYSPEKIEKGVLPYNME